jgi:hypothetical protein
LKKRIDVDCWYWRNKSSENVKEEARKWVISHLAGFKTNDRYTNHNMRSFDGGSRNKDIITK